MEEKITAPGGLGSAPGNLHLIKHALYEFHKAKKVPNSRLPSRHMVLLSEKMISKIKLFFM